MNVLLRGPWVFVLLSAVVLSPIFAAGLCCDDFMYAHFAQHVRQAWDGLPGARSRPLTTWALVGLLRLDAQARWLLPILRVLQHGGNGWLVAYLGRIGWRLSWPCSLLGGAAFVVWACHGEVYYHSALHDVTATTCTLVALLLAQRQRYAWMVLCAVAAYASKESAWMLPALVLSMPFMAVRAKRWAAGLCGAAWLGCLATRWALGVSWRGQLEPSIYADLSPTAMLHTLPKLIFRTLVPGTLDGQAWVAPIKEHMGLSIALAATVSLIAAWSLRRTRPSTWWLLAAYALALAPVHLLSVSVESAENSRYLYLPSAFFVLFVAASCDAAARPRQAIVGVATLLLVPFGLSLHAQGLLWQQAARQAAQAASALRELASAQPSARTLYLACIPDSYGGALAARNALENVGPLLEPPREVVVLATHYLRPPDGQRCRVSVQSDELRISGASSRPSLAQPVLQHAERGEVGPFTLVANGHRWAGRVDEIRMTQSMPLPSDALLAYFDGERLIPVSGAMHPPLSPTHSASTF